MLNRRQLLSGMGLGAAAYTTAGGGSALAAAKEPELGDNGLYIQPFFLESFLDLKEDLAEATGENKRLAVLWEQRGCPYCRELHRVNLQHKKIRPYIEENFTIVQLDLWGSREVTDFDGEAMEERELAKRWGVRFTPSMMFFPTTAEAVEGKTGRDAEVFRMPGYFKPFHFISVLEYVKQEKYASIGFQRYLQEKFEDFRKRGVQPGVW